MPEERTESPLLEVSDPVELRLADPETGEVHRYRTVVTDVAVDGFCVSLPTEGGVPVPFAAGTRLAVSLWKGFADHRFPARVLGRQAGHVPALRLSAPVPAEVRRTPRRDYFRADTRLPVHLRLGEGEGQGRLPAVMVDVSGGGCGLRLGQPLAVGATVRLDFDLPLPADREGHDHTRPIRDLLGRVQSCRRAGGERLRRGQRPHHLAGIEFTPLDNTTRNTLLRYVAWRQREVLRQLVEGRGPDPQDARQRRAQALQSELEELEEQLRAAGQEVPAAADGRPVAPAPEPEPEAVAADAPLEPVPAGLPAGVKVLPPTAPANGRTVLLVEDEGELRAVLAEVLQARGYAVAQAGNGQEGLAVALAERPDVVVTDLMMPRMNGWRLVAGLRERGLEVPVIVITGYMTQEGQEVLTNRQIAGFLTKPVDLEQMLSMVNGVFAAPEGRPARILVVGEPPEGGRGVAGILEGAGFVVQAAGGGREVPSQLGAFHPDLVLVDLPSPEDGGLELARRLRATPSTAAIPIVLITGSSSAEYVHAAVRLRLNGYLVRPFAPEALVERVRGVLRLKASG
ncbi:MAG: response regulator [Candidatus Latescibacterota bacterium]